MHKVKIDDLPSYSIEFTYNGMSYESVLVNKDKKNGSKAAEGENRNMFNEKYTSIIPNGAAGAGGQQTYGLRYKTKDYFSEIDYEGGVYGYSGQKYPINKTAEKFLIKATTENGIGPLDSIKTPEQVRKEYIVELKNINLGLKERAQPDLTLKKDISHVKVEINNAVFRYDYADRGNYEEYDGNSMDPQVRYQSEYGEMSYTRALYPSDVYYKNSSQGSRYPSDQLTVKVIYQIGIRNTSSELTTIANELYDYYDDKYDTSKVRVGKQIGGDNEVINSIPYNVQSSGYDKYEKIHIKDLNMKLEPETEDILYVQLEVKQDKIEEIVRANDTNNDPVKLDNVVEIASYSNKDSQGKTYAGIDIDSQPGNAKPNDQKTFEDDTDQAPGLVLVLRENRSIEGTVFFDEIAETDTFKVKQTNTGQIREANGEFDEEEKGIKGVTVQLINKAGRAPGQVAEIYEGGRWVTAQKTTDEDGHYYFEGFIPENYEIQYTWGGQTYKLQDGTDKLIRVQDYKSTVYKENYRQNDVYWYTYGYSVSYSDAMDNYVTRQKIDKQSEMMTNYNQDIINAYNSNGKMKLNEDDTTGENLITTMDSHTPNFRIDIEDNSGTLQDEGEWMNYNSHDIQDVDFGITERAKQTLELTKRIKRARLVLADGNVLIDAKIDKDKTDDGKRKLIDQVKYTTYMAPTLVEKNIAKKNTVIERNKGLLKFELDNEIQQAARLEIEYEIQVNNLSEVDYLNKEYYHYGKGYGEKKEDLATLSAQTVIDYLDNNLSNNFEVGAGQKWTTYTDAEKTALFNKGLLANTPTLKEIVTKKTKAVMNTKTLDKVLKPQVKLEEGKDGVKVDIGETQTITELNAYRQLPSVLREEDSSVGNNSEIIKVIKSGGSTITTKIGNYEPSNDPLIGEKEEDEATSEILTIIPATGLSTEVVAYTILIISSLGVLICGIILIKKYVLK